MSEIRLIDANAFIRNINEWYCKPCKEQGNDYHGIQCRACGYGDVIDNIEDAPTIESRAVGEWVHDSNGVYCSNCKSYYETITYWNGDIHVHNDIFCGRCGADMRKEDPEA